MGNPFLGEIRLFAGSFAPVGWNFCDGSQLSIANYTALYELIGTTYGGDGQTYFNLPDLRCRIPLHMGNSNSFGAYPLGQMGGVETVTLNTQQLPAHTHALLGSTDIANTPNPASNVLGRSGQVQMFINGSPSVAMDPNAIGPPVGGSESHDNIQPFLCISFIISLVGVFPPASK